MAITNFFDNDDIIDYGIDEEAVLNQEDLRRRFNLFILSWFSIVTNLKIIIRNVVLSFVEYLSPVNLFRFRILKYNFEIVI